MSDKIKITIECTGEELESANFLLGQAYDAAKDNPSFQKLWEVSKESINKGEEFRKKMLEAYFALCNPETPGK